MSKPRCLYTVEDVIERAGFDSAIVRAAHARGMTMHQDVPRKWRTHAYIPERNWALLIELTGLTPNDLYRANRLGEEVKRVA